MHDHEELDELVEYSPHFTMMVAKADRIGKIDDADGHAKQRGKCKDTVEIFFKVKDGHIEKLTFQVSGCLNTVACCNTLSCMVEGRSLQECWKILPEHIVTFLESLPADHFHCAELTVGTFYKALTEYNRKLTEQLEQKTSLC